MLKRLISTYIENYLTSDTDKILCITGARQVGKTFIIREVGKRMFPNFIEINLIEDSNNRKLFADVKNVNDFYFRLNILFGDRLKNDDKTLIFLDEIQVYPHLLTLLKFLREDNKYRYICSGSLLGLSLFKTTSIPIGSIIEKVMYPLNFKEFLMANGFSEDAIEYLRQKFINKESLDLDMHNYILDLLKKYLIIGGLPDVVNMYLKTNNIYEIREFQSAIYQFYGDDATRYDIENKLKTKRIYDMLVSNIKNKIKRVVYTEVEGKEKRFTDYEKELMYLIYSGITLECKAISNPKFPLIETSAKNLIKLYLNDVGLLSNILYKHNVDSILKSDTGVNHGALYETLAAGLLKSNNHNLFYFDKRKLGEVDFLIDDYDTLSVLPIEIKSGKDSSIYRAIPKLVTDEYKIKYGYVFSNEREVTFKDNLYHLPIYYLMFV